MSEIVSIIGRLQQERAYAAIAARAGKLTYQIASSIGIVETLCAAAIDHLFSDLGESHRLATLAVYHALELDPSTYPRPLVARARLTSHKDLATVLRHQARYEEAHEALDSAAIIADGEPALEHDRCILRLARALTFSSEQRYQEAVELLDQAVATFAEFEDDARIGQCLHALGSNYHRQAAYHDAITAFTKALAFARTAGDLRAVTSLSSNLGFSYFEAGDFASAASAFSTALPLAEELALRPEYASIVWGLALVLRASGAHEQAAQRLEYAGDRFHAIGMPEEVGLCALDAAEAHLASGNVLLAREQLQRSLRAFTNARLPDRAQAALAYLRELVDCDIMTPQPILHLRHYLAARPLHAFSPKQ